MTWIVPCIFAGVIVAAALALIGFACTAAVETVRWAASRWRQRGARRAHAGLHRAFARVAELEREERLARVTGATRLRDCVPGYECGVWDPRGDRPVAVFCANHCPDCASGLGPCAVHDQAVWAAIERQALA